MSRRVCMRPACRRQREATLALATALGRIDALTSLLASAGAELGRLRARVSALHAQRDSWLYVAHLVHGRARAVLRAV